MSNKLVSKLTLLNNQKPMGKVNIFKVGSEWKGEIEIDIPVKCTITIWDKTQDGIKSKVQIFMNNFIFKTPPH